MTTTKPVTKKKKFDLATLAPVERVIEITDPSDSGEEIGIRVSIISLMDPRMLKLKRKLSEQALQREQRNKKLKASEFEANLDEVLLTAITGWDWYGDIEFEGAVPEFTRANVLMVFERLPWFRAQIDKAVNEEEAFFRSSKN